METVVRRLATMIIICVATTDMIVVTLLEQLLMLIVHPIRAAQSAMTFLQTFLTGK